MSRWLRFLTIIVSGWFKERVDLNKESRLLFWVWLTDADLTYVNNASVLSYTEFGRIDFMSRSGVMRLCLKEKIFTASATTHLSFLRPMKRFQRIELRSRIIYWDTKWIWIRQELFIKHGGGDKIAAVAIVKGTFKKGRDFLPFDQLLARVGMHVDPMPLPDVVAKLESAEAQMS